MLTSADLKKIVTEARPLIEQQLDLTEQVAGLREVVTAAGGDWSQLKALVKAQIQDERDEAGDGKRVRKILDKADYAHGYADMLGLAKMNEKNSFADEASGNPAFDKRLEEVADRIDPALLIQLIEGSKTAAGRAVIMAAIQVVKGEKAANAETGEIIENNEPADTAPAVVAAADGESAPGPDALPVDTNSDTTPPVSDDDGSNPAIMGEADPSVSPALHPQPASPADLPEAPASGERIQIDAIRLTASVEGEAANVAASPAIPETSNVVPLKSYANDPPHPDCLKPSLCKGYSNIKLCQACIDVASGQIPVVSGGVEIRHEGRIGQ